MRMAALSKLELAEEDMEKYRIELSTVLQFIEQLGELDTEGVEPSCRIMRQAGAMRKDEVKPSMDKEKVLMNAERVEAGYFKVPKIVE